MKQSNILVICPTKYDKYGLERLMLDPHCKIFFHEYDQDSFDNILAGGSLSGFEKYCPQLVINQLLDVCEKNSITGVFSSDDYPGCIYASIIAQYKKFPGPKPAILLGCQHKYYARRHQQKLVPHATPPFYRLQKMTYDINTFPLEFPVFVKPVKSYFSYLASSVHDGRQLSAIMAVQSMPENFLYQFNWFLQQSGYEPEASDFLAEGLLEGEQVTVEGYVYNNECTIIGITDSIMYPGTISFMRFEYPSKLSHTIQQRMNSIAQTLMEGIGFNNSFFNIEMIYNSKKDTVSIIEVNSRMCGQFSDLYEKVDGVSSYALAVSLAAGNKPPHIKNQGAFKIGASCVLRLFEDKKVIAIPSQQDIENLLNRFPEARVYIHANPGTLLSSQLQDGHSYLYCLIHLAARNQQELLEKLEIAQQLLPFKFAALV
jgi:hypothetical protein